jgi:cbb3-type cytochrome oxidase subunit 3
MYRHILESLDNIQAYPLFSLLLFFTFFVAIIIWVVKSDKKYINKLKNLPLDDVTIRDDNFEGGK